MARKTRHFPTPQSVLNDREGHGSALRVVHGYRAHFPDRSRHRGVDRGSWPAAARHARQGSGGSDAVKESQVPVGEGKMPIPQISAQLVKMKYNGCVNLEYEIQAENPDAGHEEELCLHARRAGTCIAGVRVRSTAARRLSADTCRRLPATGSPISGISMSVWVPVPGLLSITIR